MLLRSREPTKGSAPGGSLLGKSRGEVMPERFRGPHLGPGLSLKVFANCCVTWASPSPLCALVSSSVK